VSPVFHARRAATTVEPGALPDTQEIAMTHEEMLVEKALTKLREARDLLGRANAPRAKQRAELAISSALGARRNVGYRATRARMSSARVEIAMQSSN
jgi:hypothetical protein